jgi:hypothetical protein
MRSPVQRIAVISDDSVGSGGAAAVALESARMLSRRGFHVIFFTGDAGSNPALKSENIDA